MDEETPGMAGRFHVVAVSQNRDQRFSKSMKAVYAGCAVILATACIALWRGSSPLDVLLQTHQENIMQVPYQYTQQKPVFAYPFVAKTTVMNQQALEDSDVAEQEAQLQRAPPAVQTPTLPGNYPPQYPPQYAAQYPPQYSSQNTAQYLPQPSYGAPSQTANTCAPCSNSACDTNGAPGGCWSTAPGPTGYTCECPLSTAKLPQQTPLPILGSQEWKDLRSNQYGNPLAISEADSQNGMLTASYEAGQVAYQLSRYLKHQANDAKVQSQIADVILKDLKSVQPCRLVPGGPGGYRCSKSDDDEGDFEDNEHKSGSPSTPSTDSGNAPKNGVLGLGFMGLSSTPKSLSESNLASSEVQPLTLDQAKELQKHIALLREDARALPSSIQSDLVELQHETSAYEAAQKKGSLGLGIDLFGLKI